MTGSGSGKRGRPLGYKLSEYSRMSISMSKQGQKHKPETIEKISRSLVMFFRKRDPLSEELSHSYNRFDNNREFSDWMFDVHEDLDSTMNILTEKSMRNKEKIEIACGDNIEYFSHNITPEFLLLLKEEIIEQDFELYEYLI